MSSWPGLPPIDVGGWADFQRKRLDQYGRERIAGLGAVASDWGSEAQRRIEAITGRVGEAAAGIQAALPGGAGWEADLERIRQEAQASEAQFPAPEPTGPAGFTLPQTGTPEGEAITSALAETATRETPGGAFMTNVARNVTGNLGPMTAETPVENVAGMAGLALQNVGAPLPGRWAGRAFSPGVVQEAGARAVAEAIPGGQTSVLEGAEIPPYVPFLGGQTLTKDTPVLGGLTTPDELLPLAAGAFDPEDLVGLGNRGLRATDSAAGVTGDSTAWARDALDRLARRYGTVPEPGPAAVAGRGLRPESSQFGIPADEFTPRDVEGRVLEGAEGTAEELTALPGAPGGSRATPGLSRTRSVRAVPEEVAARTAGTIGEDGVREAATPYEYLTGMAQDYEAYRNFYPDFGTFYRRLTEPAGRAADALFNELGAMWAATAAQTAPHDNLIKALQSSIAGRRFRELTGRLPDADELLYLLKEGKAAPGLTYERVRARPADPERGVEAVEAVLRPVLGPQGVLAEVPEAHLQGSARKITSDDARKIASIWETGKIDIPTNFKLTAFNILNALAARNQYAPWSVIDTHMFRLFGYGDARLKAGDMAGDPTASRYVQATILRLADDLGWEPHQVQSALWYGAKNEISPVSVKTAVMKGEAARFAGVPEGTEVDDGTLAYSIQKAWDAGVLPDFLKNHAPSGPINALSGEARVRFTGEQGPPRGFPPVREEKGARISGRDPETGRRYGAFRLDEAEQAGASAWMENRGYTTTVDAGPEELRALGYDRDSGTIEALTQRGVPHAVTENVDGSVSVQLFARSDVRAQEAQGVLTGALGEGRVPPLHRPILEPQQGGRGVGAPTGQAFQVDKVDGSRWTLPEVQAARRAGLRLRPSPDGVSLVARADELPPGTTPADLERELVKAGAPPLSASAVDVRTLPPAVASAPAPPPVAPFEGGQQGLVSTPSKGAGVSGALRGAIRSLEPAGAAATQGERAFDVAGGTLGGVTAAATAEEDATPQERAGRFLAGATAGSLVGPTARGALGQVAGRSVTNLGAAAGAAGQAPPVPAAQGALTKLGAVTQAAQAIPLASPPSLLWNTASGAVRTAQRFLQDSAGNLDRPAGIWADLVGMGGAIPKAAAEARKEFLNLSERGATTQGVAPGGLSDSKALWARILTGGTRANAATDQFFRTLNESGARAAAGTRGVTGEAAEALATKAGDFASFLGPNSPIADALVGAGRWANDRSLPLPRRLFGATVAGFAPYVRTPERILTATARLATDPVTQSLYALPKAVLKGDKEATREAIGRLGVAVPLAGFFAHDYLAGELRGDPPANPTERRRQEAQGAKWNTWRGVPLGRVGPVGGAASAVATAMAAGERAILRGEHPADLGRDVVNAMGRWALSNSYLEDLQNFSEDVASGRLAQAAEKQGVSMATRPLSPLTSAAAAFDPVERAREGTGQELLYKLPGGRFALPERIDPTSGQAMRRRGNFATRYAGFASGAEPSPEGLELNRYGVNAPEWRAGEAYAGMPQTGAQARALTRASGSEIGREVRQVLASPTFAAADEEEKQRLLRGAMDWAREAADLAVGDTVARDQKSKANREYQAVPRYEDIKGTPDEIRRMNARVRRAKAELAAAIKADPERGEQRFLRERREDYRLADRRAVDADDLRAAREKIEAKYGVELS